MHAIPALATACHRRALIQALLISAGSVALSACSEAIGDSELSFQALNSLPARSALEADPVIYAVTTRKLAGDGHQAPWYGVLRSNVTNFAKVSLNPPDRSITGRVASAVTGDWSIARVEPVETADAGAALAKLSSGRDLLLYVHGFNETFETATLSATKLSHGIHFSGVTAMFAWPSKGELLDYGYDRESALWSRDAFQDLLETLAKDPSIGRIHIVAHSMGTLLTLETLRQIAARSGDSYAGKFGAIILASPDIDVDVFAATLAKLGDFSKKLTVITSTDDNALDLSRRLAGGIIRVGAEQSTTLKAMGVKVVDASGLDWGMIKHDRFLSNGHVRAEIRSAIDHSY